MTYSAKERIRIHLRAKRKLGLTKSGDMDDFIEQCVSNMTDDGMSEDDATEMCQNAWEEHDDD